MANENEQGPRPSTAQLHPLASHRPAQVVQPEPTPVVIISPPPVEPVPDPVADAKAARDAQVAAGRKRFGRYLGRHVVGPTSEGAARAFGVFDPKETKPQLAEHWRYNFKGKGPL